VKPISSGLVQIECDSALREPIVEADDVDIVAEQLDITITTAKARTVKITFFIKPSFQFLNNTREIIGQNRCVVKIVKRRRSAG
jgi:hypothetical protein